MGRQHVDHGDIVRFAEEKVNLKKEDAKEMRAQANRLGEKLEQYLTENPHFELSRMMLSGSLAKGTALKSTSDVDMACYVSSDTAPRKIGELISWLIKKLQTAFPQFKPEQIKPKEYSISVTFMGTGNEVDIVPILYTGDPQWRGNLVSQDTGEMLMTSVPMHLEFIRKRKKASEIHYAQLVRLLKFWCKLRKQQDSDFRFKSFMVELVIAHLADGGMRLDDYPEALAKIFTYLAAEGLRSAIAFNDYYDARICKITSDPVRIWDPVNHENNVAKLYTIQHKSKIAEAALDAGDAVDSALRATTKGETMRYWQKVFGPTFNA